MTISQEHCSDYIAFTRELNMKDNELYVKDELDDKETDKNSTSLDKAPDTGDTSVTYVYLLIELGAMISIAALNLKKRKER